MIPEYLAANHRRLALQRYAVAERPEWLIITPRFRASSHVIYLVLAERTCVPALAVKVARLFGDRTSLDRESAHLRAIQTSRPDGYASIPRVVTYEEHLGHPVLVETALAGVPMAGALVRRDPARCCEALLDWLIDVQSASRSPWHCDASPRLIEQPLARMAAALGPDGEDERLIAGTMAHARALAALQVPLVFEHGDLSHPNILVMPDGGVGVLDWETAEPAGLPACDLFFFLTYIAHARLRPWSREGHVDAFEHAFFGPGAWTRPYVERYALRLGVPAEALTPLFVLGWARYLAALLDRVGTSRGGDEPRDEGTAAWLRRNRFHLVWRHALRHTGRLCWNC